MATPSILYLRRLGSASALADVLRHHPRLAEQSVAEQHEWLGASRSPFSAPMTAELGKLGWDASELILGVPSIRDAWIREHGRLPEIEGVEDPDVRMAVGEVLRRRPDVVLDVNVTALDRHTVPHLRKRVPELQIVAGRMGTTKRYHRALHLDVSLVPCGVIAGAIRPYLSGSVHVLPHSFDPDIVTELSPRRVDHPLVFSGVLGPRYSLRHEVLMALLEGTSIEAYIGLRKGVERTQEGHLVFDAAHRSLRSKLIQRVPPRILASGARRSERFAYSFNAAMARRSGGATLFPDQLPDPQHHFPERCHEAVAGRAYLDLVRRSGTVVHRETDDLDGCGGALRLFEVTGVGAALLVDDSPMTRLLFKAGEEVITYATPSEAVEKARWLTDHPDAREQIAAAGQARTLRDHSTPTRAKELDEILRLELERAARRPVRNR